jgi:hypothetical protein
MLTGNGRLRIYSSTTALLSNCGRDVTSPFDIFEIDGRDEKIITVVPAASAASAIAFPCAISVVGDLLSQTFLLSTSFSSLHWIIRYRVQGLGMNAHNP